MGSISEIIEIYQTVGEDRYGDEPICQLAHALQCAELAATSDASHNVVAAALLHDIGHLVDSKFELGQLEDVDRQHENIGAAWLSRYYPPAVTEPIRLHVDAKRYLCHADKDYFATLSDASVRSLHLQGGVFNQAEAAAFIATPYATDAVSVRRWDDEAKVPGQQTRQLDDFLPYLERALSAELSA